MFRTLRSPGVLLTTLLAAGILAITMGTRQSLGLFVSPLNSATGLGIATISFAMAIGQFSWGAIQPVAGAVADRYGRARCCSPRWCCWRWAAPSRLHGFRLRPRRRHRPADPARRRGRQLLGADRRRRPAPAAEARGSASGVINAGGSFGQFVFAPIVQKLIQSLGWASAMGALAVMALAALPLVARLTRPRCRHPRRSRPGPAAQALRSALADRSYLLLHLGFFTCGFHIAFLVTHLPGEVDLCGCRPRSPAGRWPSSAWPTSSAACTPAPACRATAASTCWR
jgi:MFS family permease